MLNFSPSEHLTVGEALQRQSYFQTIYCKEA